VSRSLLIVAAIAVFATSTISAREIVDIAFELMQKELKTDEWKTFVKKTTRTFEEWSNDNPDGSLKRFLDDRLLTIASGVTGGNVKALKKMVIWISLYREFGEPVPEYIREVGTECEADVEQAMNDFTWEKAAEKIKNRKKEHDKRKGREESQSKKKKKND
jgi:hypothetical protein